MARLSSIISTRRLLILSMIVRGLGGQVEGETCAGAGSVAAGGQRAAHFAGGQGAAVQAKTVAALARGKSVVEYSQHVLGRNSNSVVNHLKPHPFVISA